MDRSKYEEADLCMRKIKEAEEILAQVKGASEFRVYSTSLTRWLSLARRKKEIPVSVSGQNYSMESVFGAMRDAAIVGLRKKIEYWEDRLGKL